MSNDNTNSTIVIGAGPAGLACAYQLLKHNISPLVLEADPTYVGGLARTVKWKANRFDIGGHRFFTRSPRVEHFWSHVLGKELLIRPRSSRIMYKGTLLNYPLQLGDAFNKLGFVFLIQACSSYLWAQLFGPRGDRNFEEWIVRRFGRKMFTCFFKSYTEKVWGIPCDEISADWAAQRIHGLSVPTLIKNILFRDSTPTAKTLIDKFEYPRLGPGQLWEEVTAIVSREGGEVCLDKKVCKIIDEETHYRVITANSDGVKEEYSSESIVSTMPLRELCTCLQPAAPDYVLEAATSLQYRDFLVVALLLDCPSPFPDQWLYIHEPDVKVGRIQNMANWSKDLVADPNTTVLLFEYFCLNTDKFWQQEDSQLLNLAKSELQQLAVAPGVNILDGTVIRVPKAYPLYNDDYLKHLGVIREYLANYHPRIQTVGRNGMHRYNNQDHAILTGFLAADTLAGVENSDTAWQVNQNAQYIEERLIPQRV